MFIKNAQHFTNLLCEPSDVRKLRKIALEIPDQSIRIFGFQFGFDGKHACARTNAEDIIAILKQFSCNGKSDSGRCAGNDNDSFRHPNTCFRLIIPNIPTDKYSPDGFLSNRKRIEERIQPSVSPLHCNRVNRIIAGANREKTASIDI